MHSKGASTARHKELGDAISFHLQAAGMAVYPEVKHLDEDRRTRPDFVVISRDNEGKSVRILTDHTIVNPMASSRARTDVAASLATVARKKHRKYDEAARRFDASLVPMVFSTLGNIAPEALQVLRLERAGAVWTSAPPAAPHSGPRTRRGGTQTSTRRPLGPAHGAAAAPGAQGDAAGPRTTRAQRSRGSAA